MSIEVVGEIFDLEVIAVGGGIRELSRLRRRYGKGRWRKMKGIGDRRRLDRKFVVCHKNNGYEASLERNKIYVVVPDQDAEAEGDIRVVDESGEDYLYPAHWFVALEVPKAIQAAIVKAS